MHMHSIFSDGELDVKELVNRIKEKDLSLAILTDHDSFGGSKEFIQELKKEGIKSYPCCELTTYRNNEPIHILAFYKSYESIGKDMFDYLSDMQKSRYERMKKMTDNMNKLYGLGLNFDNIINKHKNTLSRPHLADEIALKTGLPIREIFEKYIGDDCPGYIPSTLFKTEDGIDLIHKTGGYAILAHPYLYKKNQFLDLMNLSFDGVEVFYSPSPVKKYKKVLKYALKHNLLITGGSDFHRDIDQEKHEFIGTSIISDEYILKFIEFMEK